MAVTAQGSLLTTASTSTEQVGTPTSEAVRQMYRNRHVPASRRSEDLRHGPTETAQARTEHGRDVEFGLLSPKSHLIAAGAASTVGASRRRARRGVAPSKPLLSPERSNGMIDDRRDRRQLQAGNWGLRMALE